LNNDGGGIFSFLPQAKKAEHFEELFGTPLGLDFCHVASLYGLAHQKPATKQAFMEGLKKSLLAPGVSLLEVSSNREANLRLHQKLSLAAMRALEPCRGDTNLP
jgi:2-succinyl-5-enolpyruvyl-6-hydroxy-3-cyclohexene-1-carboxylate synthase